MLNIKNISKTYIDNNKRLTVLDNLSLKVEKSQIITIFGKSGIGKSTLLNIIGGLAFPDNGTIKINNNLFEYDKCFEKFRSDNFGYIFQEDNLLPEFTVEENLMIPSMITNFNYNKTLNDINNYLSFFHMSNYLNSYPSQLSKGERQRISIIRSIIKNPKIILADEPTANLDEKNIELILSLFVKLNKELNYTFIIATHDKSFQKISDKIYEIKKKKLRLLK